MRLSSAERRALLVQAALRVIAEQGVAGATTRAIVAEAGMSLASFHYAFRSHAEMMRELIAHVVDAEVAAAFATVTPGSDIRSTLRSGMQAYLDYVVADPAHEQVMFELFHYALRTPGLEVLAREQYARYHESVARVVVGGAEAVGVEWSIPSADVARLIVTFTDGITLAWLADRDDAAAHRTLDFAADSLAALAVRRSVPVPADASQETR